MQSQNMFLKFINFFRRNSTLIVFSTLGFLILGGVLFTYYHFFNHLPISTNNNNWGQFGSFVGGLSGALLSFITVILLAFTLKKQIDSNRITRFESSFFELIQMNRILYNKLDGEKYFLINNHDRINDKFSEKVFRDSNSINENDGFIDSLSKVINNKFDRNYTEIHRIKIAKAVKAGLENRSEENQSEILSELDGIKLDKIETKKIISDFYDKLYYGHESKLGHYLRSLYHCIKFIKDSDLDIEHKQKFADIIQAHLSDSELHLIMYNGIGIYGNKRFLPLIEEFKLLENINDRGPFFQYHMSLYYPNNYSNWIEKPKSDSLTHVSLVEIKEFLLKE